MALIDEHTFFATAGRGGDGVVHWHREKFKPKGGPDGGDGGRGGHLYVEGVRDITALKNIIRKNKFKADDGKAGGKNSMHGADGEDFVVKLPTGSIITNQDTGESFELIREGEKILLLKGGKGGLGNEHFKSSINQTPTQATKGGEGEQGRFHVELRLIADVGLVGLPNAGKTSLLNALTNAKAKVAEYSFTTLDPNLGVYQNYIIADIPGLIEGASEGKGLGHKFLRHITRTSVILHCISLERDTVIEDYKLILNELDLFPGLSQKKEYIVLTKSDAVPETKVKEVKSLLENKLKKKVLATVTILDDTSVKKFADLLVEVLRTQIEEK
jgi:GTP-binding protein